MEKDNEQFDPIENAPIPVETGLAPVGERKAAVIEPEEKHLAKVGTALTSSDGTAPGDPRRVTEIHGDIDDDDSMSGGFASVKGRRKGDNRLVWTVLILMCVLCIAVAVCSSVLTAFFMRRGTPAPEIDTDGSKQDVAAVVSARKSVVAEVISGGLRGSGVIVKYENGKAYLLTNAHVIGASNIRVRFAGEDLAETDVTILGYNSYFDVAVISVAYNGTVYTLGEGENFTRDLKFSEGDRVVAIGNGMGMGIASYDGIISRKAELLKYDEKTVPVLRTTAAINAGMSGGALFDMNGRLVGLNTYRMTSTEESGGHNATNDVEDTGFVVPVSIVYPLYKQIMEFGNGNTELPGIINISCAKADTSAIGAVTLGSGLNFTGEYRLGKFTVTSLDYGLPPVGISEDDILTQIGAKSVSSDICELCGELLCYNASASGGDLKLTFDHNGTTATKTIGGFKKYVD